MGKMVYTEFRTAIDTIEKLATDNKAFYNLIRQCRKTPIFRYKD